MVGDKDREIEIEGKKGLENIIIRRLNKGVARIVKKVDNSGLNGWHYTKWFVTGGFETATINKI